MGLCLELLVQGIIAKVVEERDCKMIAIVQKDIFLIANMLASVSFNWDTAALCYSNLF